MYKISVPIMSTTVNMSNREEYVRQFREVGAERVFIALGTPVRPIPRHIIENVNFFKSQGFEVGVWIDTIGHGFVLAHVEEENPLLNFSQMVDIDGKRLHHANCPCDERFKKYISEYVGDLAKTGADIVMLDDDFRMSQHGGGLSCACPEHMKRISKILGECISVEELRPYVLTGKANKYRNAWIQAQNEGLVELAKEIRKSVDAVAPNVTVCFCTAFAPWNVDGLDVSAITKILAGKNKPIVRLTGAPYWATKEFRYPLITVFEIARMLASFVCGNGFEIMSEGDVYPRPRYTCPASYLELYDAVTRIDGAYSGILKYMFDYVAEPNFETGYLKFHKHNEPYLKKVSELFAEGANAGVKIITYPHTMRDADLDVSTLHMYSPCPADATMLGSCGIPTIYRGEGVCNSVFGENARSFDLSRLYEGTVLDAVSAIILTERGVDVGIEAYGALVDKNISFLCAKDVAYKSFIKRGKGRMLTPVLKESAEELLFATEQNNTCTVAYKYENANGERFLVFLFEGDSLFDKTYMRDSGLLKNYATQKVLTEELPWVARKALPAYCAGNPELYLMCRKEEDSMVVAMFNCFADPLIDATVVLDGEYKTIECVGCEAELLGNKVTLKGQLYGFTSAMFRVRR